MLSNPIEIQAHQTTQAKIIQIWIAALIVQGKDGNWSIHLFFIQIVGMKAVCLASIVFHTNIEIYFIQGERESTQKWSRTRKV